MVSEVWVGKAGEHTVVEGLAIGVNEGDWTSDRGGRSCQVALSLKYRLQFLA